MINNETKCYNCSLEPNTCYCKCKFDDAADWEYVDQLAPEHVRDEFTVLALKKCIYDMEMKLDRERELLALEAGYFAEEEDVYTRHCAYLHDDPADPNAPY